MAFSGWKLLVHECTRKSAKAEREDAFAVSENIGSIERMVRMVANKNNLEVENHD